MATVAHIIRSYYDPADRERLEYETGQRVDDQSDPWQTESSISAQRRVRAAPTFVPATALYDEWGIPSQPTTPQTVQLSSTSSTAEFYRSLTAASSVRPARPPRPASAPAPTPDAKPSQERPRARLTKNDWFIGKVLRSEPSTEPNSPAPSLADLLARDPPPLPSEGRFKPSVWLHIGPSNKGFGMLQRSGWNEGEGLGAHAVRSIAPQRDVDHLVSPAVGATDDVGAETKQEVIDLTLSDSEPSGEMQEESDAISEPVERTSSSHMQTSLLTPLPITLKADRLGIGLKAKTEGPFRQSKKRVTHSAAALAAHLRDAEEMRRKKAEIGKGRRGFAKAHKKEEDWRRSMLAYLNE